MKELITTGALFLILMLGSLSGSAQVVVKVKPNRPAHAINKPAQAKAEHIWIDGHWQYDHHKKEYVWIQGRWVKENKDHHWVEGHWEAKDDGFIWVPGHWKKHPHTKGHPHHHPK